MLSMHAEETLVRQALEAGARGYILKSALDLDLAAAIKRVLAGETVLDPKVSHRRRSRANASHGADARASSRSCSSSAMDYSNKRDRQEAGPQREHRCRPSREHHEHARLFTRRPSWSSMPSSTGWSRFHEPARLSAVAALRRGLRRLAAGSRNDDSRRLGFRLTNVTRPAGLQFQHNSGAYGGKLLPETLGSGCAFLDYDADGWQDILLVNGMDWPGHKRQRSTLRLYRNNRNGTFTDVSRAAGLDIELYGMGVAVGDWDNDGYPDVFVTCVGQNRLFRNTGKGTFVDVTRTSGLAGRMGFSTSALWIRFRSRRLARPVRLQLRQVDRRTRRVLQSRRQAEVLLHARGVPRGHLLAVPQSRQRHVRRRHGHERYFRHKLEVTGCRDARLRSGRLARFVRRQRHTAEQALSQPAQRPLQGGRAWRRVSRSARKARRAPAWASTPATSTIPAGLASPSRISTTR